MTTTMKVESQQREQDLQPRRQMCCSYLGNDGDGAGEGKTSKGDRKKNNVYPTRQPNCLSVGDSKQTNQQIASSSGGDGGGEHADTRVFICAFKSSTFFAITSTFLLLSISVCYFISFFFASPTVILSLCSVASNGNFPPPHSH